MSVPYVISVIIALVAIIIAALALTLAVSDSFKTVEYNLNASVRTGHTYLIAAAVFSWIAVVVLGLLILLTSISSLGVAPDNNYEFFNNNRQPEDISKEDAQIVFSGRKELNKAKSSGFHIFIMIGLVIVFLHTIIVGVLSVIAYYYLSSSKTPDTFLSSAKTAAIVGIIASVVAFFGMIGAMIFYWGVKTDIQRRADKNEELVDLTRQAGIGQKDEHPIATIAPPKQ